MRHTPARAAAAILLGWGIPSAGQSLAVTPTIVEIGPGRRGAVIEVTNNGATPIDIQVRPYDWRNTDGRDALTDSATLRVSPSIATIAAGATQSIRMLIDAAGRSADRAVERDWRILLDQLPGPPSGGGLKIKLRMSIPVFAYAAKNDAPDLRWSVASGRLTAINAGPRHARFDALAVRGADGRETQVALGETPYLLPGARREWPVRVAPSGGAIRVVGRIGTTDFSAPVALDPVR